MVTSSQIIQKSKRLPKPDKRYGNHAISINRRIKNSKIKLIIKNAAKEAALLSKKDSIFDVLQMIFNEYVETLKMNEPGVRLGIEPEFLHQMRIALRRIRVALICFKKFFPKDLYKTFHSHLKDMFKTLAKEREIDVLNAMLTAEIDKHPKIADQLKCCMQWLQEEKKKHHQSTIVLLDSNFYAQTLQHLQTLQSFQKHFPAHAFQPIGDITSAMLKTNWKALRIKGNALTLKSHDDSFHEMRIACKKMRYQCEFMQPVLNANALTFINQLKDLQATLGALQDRVTVQDVLKPYVEMMKHNGNEAQVKSIQKFLNKIDKKSRRQQTGFFVLWDQIKLLKPHTYVC